MRLHFIYTFIGISTLLLNLALTFHIIRKHTNTSSKEIWECDDVITFSLTRGRSVEDATTSAASCDDTVPLE